MQVTSHRVGSPSKRGLDPRSAFGLIVAVLFFLVSGTVAYFNVRVLRDDAQKIAHSHEVIVAVNALVSSLQDAETGQRGYLLTGKDSYLAPYNRAVADVDQRFETIATLTRDNSQQQARLEPLRRHIDGKLAELKETVEVRKNVGIGAALAIVETDRGKIEMDEVRAQLDTMHQEEARLRLDRQAEMAQAYRSAWVSGVLSCALGIVLTLAIGLLIRRAAVAADRQQWLQAGQVDLGAVMLGDQNSEQLGESVLAFLVRFTGAQAGAMFAAEGGHYRRVASYGVPADAQLVERFSLRQGLLGQVAADGEPVLLADIPDGYLTIGSTFGSDKPRHLLIAPVFADKTVQGVIELGFLQPVDNQILAFLSEISGAVGVGLRSARYRAQLQHHTEELQVQSEELRVSNEELEEQGRALKESAANLEQQQVELEQTNSQLEEQAQLLESQRDDLARSNSAVELKARELEQASRYKSDFLANMSHELRTPLNSLLILSKLLGDNRGENLTGEQVQYARTIESAGNDLLALINDILDLSKIEAGHLQIRPESVLVERLAGDLRQVFQPIAMNRKLAFEIAVAPGSASMIETDRQRIEQILKNLLSNAFKFTEAGSVRLEVEPDGDERLLISVVDTGIGIPEEQQKAIFEAFRQADGTVSRKYGGTGLGLSISRELARLLGGSISLASVAGKGSRFTLSLPVAYDPGEVAARVEPVAASLRAPMAATAPPVAKARPAPLQRQVEDDRDALTSTQRVLLVVEDDASFAGIVRDISREMGFQCLVTGTAEEALHLARTFKPHAVVLDVGLPDQSGLALLDRLKRDVETRHIPVHVVSGSDHTQTALSLGAIGYLIKPVKREELASVLDALTAKLASDARRVLIVEDDDVQRDAVGRLLATGEVETVGVATAAECLEALRTQTFDCMVLDLNLPDASGFSLLETLSKENAYSFPPVIVYTGHDLTAEDEQRLRRYSDSIIIKGARSPERLLDEVSLFLHQVVTELPPEQQTMIRAARNRDAILEGRRILVVEDDVRNVFSLTNILEPQGAVVEIARNGQEALDALEAASGDEARRIDLVLMDVMMPVMDGLTATRAIRQDPRWTKLPVIALTAKAMPDDQERCIESGANDYMAKPLDVDKLLSLVRVWMPR
ncbi:chemotaxis protein CheY [Novosphingobium barchaimii LL02]|uniref:histidine kinase n=1 Tax=Novosphingobium barchaimii LL02 TaxID=1114963 RepID=A0A0J8AJB4_9SPHN|nr:response regulator [Novosphingobium barchaimii]KMS54800.1 chemotaxis protein CheY [Novosphingobium barchaimii LL02]